MGIYCTLMQPTEDELRQIRSDPELTDSLRRNRTASPSPPGRFHQLRFFRLPPLPTPTVRLVSLEKMWHGLHFLLAGEPWGGTPPLSLAILGGDLIQERGQGSIKLIRPPQVKEVAMALSALTQGELYRR